jgi:hypothetical protein
LLDRDHDPRGRSGSLDTVLLLANDRHSLAPIGPRQATDGRFGLHVSNPGLFAKLLLPGFITSLGAGQLIPFLNLFIQTKFGLDLASSQRDLRDHQPGQRRWPS